MTRVLSELLGAPDPTFHLSLNRLERASGLPSNDIRLSSEVMRATQSKLRELGLDPHDTTGPELYAALQERLKADDARLVAALQSASKNEDIIASVAHALRNVPIAKGCFALKATATKKILKKVPPKKAMKQLGYRSLESMLKHEPVASLYAAAWLTESSTWRRNIIDQYKVLKATDFESRSISILSPASARWQQLSATIVAQKKHNVIGFKELGAIVLLPLPATGQPPAVATTTLLLALKAWNEIRAGGTFLKLCQVKPDFGSIVQNVATDEPQLAAEMLDQPVPWQIVQRYYARFKSAFRSEIFEPHVQAEDLAWHSIEKVLAHLEPSMEFWKGTTHLSLLHDHQPVSFNIIDVALNYCNQLPYEQRIVQYFRHSLWHELLLRYLKHDSVEQSVLGQLQSELVAEPALI
jgi:hypothetical protein